MILSFILALMGLLAFYLEFFLPGGIFAAGGIAFILSSIVLFFLQGPGLVSSAIYLVMLGLLIVFVCKLALRRIRIGKNFYLDQDQGEFRAAVFDSADIGKWAEVVSDLKPAGHISIEGKVCQAVSESGYIPKGATVVVTGGMGAHLKVRIKS